MLIMSLKTAYLYDAAMGNHRNHDKPDHVESPDRIHVPHEMLSSSGLVDKCLRVQSRKATKEELLSVHSEDYIREVEQYSSQEPYPKLVHPENNPTYVCDETYACALLAAGSTINIADAVCSGMAKNGLALVRPPGHHAEIDQTSGFCFFNNIAIAIKHVKKNYPTISKALVVDWDVHHGNGIQHIFYDDPDVMYISLHRYDNGTYFPYLEECSYDATGAGEGMGYNVNIPWSRDKMGDTEYRAAFTEIVLPIAEQFNPDVVVVACGLDAAGGDPLGEYHLSPEFYGWMTTKLRRFADGKLVVVLEGGYIPESMGKCLTNVTKALIGGDPDVEDVPVALQSVSVVARDTLDRVKHAHNGFWTF